MRTAETGGWVGSTHHSPPPEYNCGVTTTLRLESSLASWHFAFERTLLVENPRKAATGRNRILYLDSSPTDVAEHHGGSPTKHNARSDVTSWMDAVQHSNNKCNQRPTVNRYKKEGGCSHPRAVRQEAFRLLSGSSDPALISLAQADSRHARHHPLIGGSLRLVDHVNPTEINRVFGNGFSRPQHSTNQARRLSWHAEGLRCGQPEPLASPRLEPTGISSLLSLPGNNMIADLRCYSSNKPRRKSRFVSLREAVSSCPCRLWHR